MPLNQTQLSTLREVVKGCVDSLISAGAISELREVVRTPIAVLDFAQSLVYCQSHPEITGALSGPSAQAQVPSAVRDDWKTIQAFIDGKQSADEGHPAAKRLLALPNFSPVLLVEAHRFERAMAVSLVSTLAKVHQLQQQQQRAAAASGREAPMSSADAKGAAGSGGFGLLSAASVMASPGGSASGGGSGRSEGSLLERGRLVLTDLVRLKELVLEQTPLHRYRYGAGEGFEYSFRIGSVPFNLDHYGSAPLPGEIRSDVVAYIEERLELHDQQQKAIADARQAADRDLREREALLRQMELDLHNEKVKSSELSTSLELAEAKLETKMTMGDRKARKAALLAANAEYEKGLLAERLSGWKTAWPHYLKSWVLGSPLGAAKLAVAYLHGMGVVKINYAKAIEVLQIAVKSKAPGSVSLLGCCYECGWGVPRDCNQAARVLASDVEDALAALHLGHLLHEGKATLPGFEKTGMQLIQEAGPRVLKMAQQGDALAQYTLGWCFRLGHGGVAQDDRSAAHFFSAAAAQGSARAQARLGHVIAKMQAQLQQQQLMEGHGGHGQGLPPIPTVDEWRGTSATARAIELYRASAEQNCSVGAFYLGQCYEAGEGVRRDIAKARALYTTAAKLGLWEAQDALNKLPPEPSVLSRIISSVGAIGGSLSNGGGGGAQQVEGSGGGGGGVAAAPAAGVAPAPPVRSSSAPQLLAVSASAAPTAAAGARSASAPAPAAAAGGGLAGGPVRQEHKVPRHGGQPSAVASASAAASGEHVVVMHHGARRNSRGVSPMHIDELEGQPASQPQQPQAQGSGGGGASAMQLGDDSDNSDQHAAAAAAAAAEEPVFWPDEGQVALVPAAAAPAPHARRGGGGGGGGGGSAGVAGRSAAAARDSRTARG